jgi:tRNA (uracil-5-)-methyltransferase
MRGDSGVVQIIECPMVSEPIYNLMPKLLPSLESSEILSHKLFSIEFLSTTDTVVTLIYHKKLSEEWIDAGKELEEKFGIHIIGRSRKQKVVLSRDFVEEKLEVGDETYSFHHLENSFSQPNPAVNEKMVNWVVSTIPNSTHLLELYCGSGNFTIPLSKRFQKVLATEVSKSGISSALSNMERNGITNIEFGRVSSEEFVEALDGVRKFNRLQHIDLESYKFSTIFVDPPRAGVDSETIKLLQRFENIIYISCNPETLKRDLDILEESHTLQKVALFDQFPYTDHIEMGAILKMKDL